MTLRTRIVDGLGRRNDVEVTNNNSIKASILDYYNFTNEIRYFVNPDYGFNMNINASSNLDELVHNGTDNVAWTGSNISGVPLTFNSTVDPVSGSYHINGTSLTNGTTFQLTRSISLGTVDFNSISGWINLINLGNPVAELYISGYDTSTGNPVGNEVSIFDYINTGNTGNYQPFTIPLSDMGLESESIDAFRFTVDILSSTVTFYLDDIYLTSIGTGTGSQIFTLEPNAGETLIVDSYNFYVIDDYDGLTGQNGMMKLEWDKILGETLTYGITYQRSSNGNILFSTNLRRIRSFLTIPYNYIENYASDGTYTMMNIHYRFFEPYVMSGVDKITLTVNDNMSGFQTFRTSANCKRVLGTTGEDSPITRRTLMGYGGRS